MNRPSSAGSVVAAVFVALWVVGVSVITQFGGWFVEQYRLLTGAPHPSWQWLFPALVPAVLAAGPAALIAFIPAGSAVRAAGRAWLTAAAAGGVLGLWRVVPAVQHELYLAGYAATAAALAWLLGRLATRPRPTPATTWLAVAAGLAVLLPWLWAGALGSLAETVLAALAAAALGRLAGRVLTDHFWTAYARTRVLTVLVGGLVAGVALVPLAAGTGGAGAQLPALIALPPLGFAAAAVPRAGGWPVGLAAFGPLAFVDPREVTLLLATALDTPFWTAVAALAALVLAGLAGLAYGVGLARRPAVRPGVAATIAVVVAAVGAVAYFTSGQPGFFGERLFVVMKDQLDLSAVGPDTPHGQAGRDARVREVYRRLTEHADRSQKGLREELDRLHLPYTSYYLVNGVEVKAGGPAVRALLSGRSDVDRVLVDEVARPLPVEPAPLRGGTAAPTTPTWNLETLGAPRAWDAGATGAGIVVGSSDSGVDGRHAALAAGFRGGDDSWYDPWNGTRGPVDAGGHGTHTLASAVGRQNVGMAPGAQWTGCVNLARNLGNPARYLDCLQFMLAPFPPGADPFTAGRPERAPHILTNSWGCSDIEGCDATALLPATRAFAAAGILFVVAAGNTGPACDSIDDPPSPYADTLTVGAVDRSGMVTPFSSRGPAPGGRKPDLVAPGDDVLSALPGGGYGTLSGTSMAAPQVAGLVALLWSRRPELIGDLARTRAIVLGSTRPARPSYRSRNPEDACGGDENITGAGIPDAMAALGAAG